MYKVVHSISQANFNDIFDTRNNNGPSLRKHSYFSKPSVKTVHKGQNSLRYLGPEIWNLVPNNLKNVKAFDNFKNSIKKWKVANCPCRLCKDYVQNIGFVNLFE